MRSEVSAETERPTTDTLSWTAGQTTGKSGKRPCSFQCGGETKRIASENVACRASKTSMNERLADLIDEPFLSIRYEKNETCAYSAPICHYS